MGFLDGGFLGMGGGSSSPASIQTQTTSSNPWASQQPYLKEIFEDAQTAYQSDAPSYFPNSTVVGMSPQTEQALGSIEQRALQGSPLQQAGMDTMQQAASGQMMNSNPFLQGNIQRAQQPMIDQFNQQIAPGIDSSFSGAGRMGSGLYAQQRNSAEDTLTRGLGDMAGQMGSAAYDTERRNMMQAAQLAPGMAQSDYADANQLLAVGGARESQEAANLQDQMNRFNFEQNRPWEQLARYQGMVGGGYGQETTQVNPLYSNTAANFLGGAMGGAQLGQMTGMGAGWGALGGGLIGALG